MKPEVTIVQSKVRDVEYLLRYDKHFTVWNIYRNGQSVWSNDDGVATWSVYSAMLEEEFQNG
jgi:hypothetical protein